MNFQKGTWALFDRLHAIWQNWPGKGEGHNFWHMGNTLDASVEFLVQAANARSDQITARRNYVQQMVEESYYKFCRAYKQGQPNSFDPDLPPQFWWDDYGWWGIAFLKIVDNYDTVFKDSTAAVSKADCLQVATNCWHIMKEIAADKMNRRVPTSNKGPITGGCWNYKPDKGGVQNTVTNALFLVLSIRLYLTRHNESGTEATGYLESTIDQYLWFKYWFNQDDFLFHRPDGQKGRLVVFERPYDPQYRDYNWGQALPYEQGQIWSGDQGLLLGGLVGLWQAREAAGRNKRIQDKDPTFEQNVMALIKGIAGGAHLLFDTAGVLHEARLQGKFLTFFGVDYATGKGVFLRYLTYARRIIPALGFQEEITATAEAIWRNRNRNDNQVSLQWNEGADTEMKTNEGKLAEEVKMEDPLWRITLQTAGLDGLNAAAIHL